MKKVVEVKPATPESIKYANEMLKQIPDVYLKAEQKYEVEGGKRR